MECISERKLQFPENESVVFRRKCCSKVQNSETIKRHDAFRKRNFSTFNRVIHLQNVLLKTRIECKGCFKSMTQHRL